MTIPAGLRPSLIKCWNTHKLEWYAILIARIKIQDGNLQGFCPNLRRSISIFGIELKLASKLFKTSEFNRLAGQLRQYTSLKYSEGNLILSIIGTNEEKKETSWMRRIKELADEYETAVYFIKVAKKEESI